MSCRPELRLCTSGAGRPLSGYASNWISGVDTIACSTAWRRSFTLYCAYSLILSHTCTRCFSLYKCLCRSSCVFWEVKLVQVSERGRYWSREPLGLRAGQESAAHPTDRRPCQAGHRPAAEGGGGSREGGVTTTLILLKPNTWVTLGGHPISHFSTTWHPQLYENKQYFFFFCTFRGICM